jgi:hypothetical protein
MLKALAIFLFSCGLFCLSQSHRQLLTTGVGSSGGGGGFTPTCSQSTALLARMDGTENKSKVDAAISGIVADNGGSFPPFDAFYVYNASSQANALLIGPRTSITSLPTAHAPSLPIPALPAMDRRAFTTPVLFRPLALRISLKIQRPWDFAISRSTVRVA